MILLDTDTLTLLALGHHKVSPKFQSSNEPVAITIVTRIEVLQGRFDFVMKAADGNQLQEAQRRLIQTEADLNRLPTIAIDLAAAREFDRLCADKKSRRIGRADLLIASIALAHRATLVTRNVKHFQLVANLQVENWAD